MKQTYNGARVIYVFSYTVSFHRNGKTCSMPSIYNWDKSEYVSEMLTK